MSDSAPFSSDSAAEAPTFRLRAAPDEAPTQRVMPAETATRRVGSMAPATERRALGYLESGVSLARGCVVEATIAPHESARPGVYRCHSPLEGRVAVKIAALAAPPDESLWNRLPTLHHRHVLHTLETFRGEDDGFFYEIQEWCAGGTLASRIAPVGVARDAGLLEWLEKAVVPAFCGGIAYLHEQNIIHRDIKPSNFYFRERAGASELVIGDFDISSLLRDGRTSRDTSRAAGTWIYAAPEAFPRFTDESGRAGSRVARASDFYSFGVVLLEILVGTTPLHGGDFPDVFDFYVSGRTLEVPDDLPARWRELLRGLLIRDRHTRWGAAHMARWLARATTDEDRAAIAADRGLPSVGTVRPFTAFAAAPTTLEELASAMLEEPQVAREELLNGDVLLNWIGEIDSGKAREIRLDRQNWRGYGEIAVLCALLRCHAHTPAFLPPDTLAFSAREWAQGARKAVESGAADAESLCHSGALLWLEHWLRLKDPAESELSARVALIRARRERAEAQLGERAINADTVFAVNLAARSTPTVAKGVRGAGYGKARGFALENEAVTPAAIAVSCGIAPDDALTLAAQLERDGVLTRETASPSVPAPEIEPAARTEVILEELSHLFEPEKPFHVGLDAFARTPHEVAALCFGGEWGDEPPALFRAACQRWQDGFLEAWLRARLPVSSDGRAHPLLAQIESARLNAVSVGEAGAQNARVWALFDAVLRLFDPQTPPVVLELRWSSPAVLMAPYGTGATRTLHFAVRGPGIAFGALELTGALAGLELTEHLVCGRRGAVEIYLHGGGDMVTGVVYTARVTLKSQTTRPLEELAPLRYGTDYPREQTRQRLATGIAVGAATLAIPRFVAMLGELPTVATGSDAAFSQLWTQTRAGTWPHLALVIATAILLVSLYAGFRAWLWALRHWSSV